MCICALFLCLYFEACTSVNCPVEISSKEKRFSSCMVEVLSYLAVCCELYMNAEVFIIHFFFLQLSNKKWKSSVF